MGEQVSMMYQTHHQAEHKNVFGNQYMFTIWSDKNS